jgi:ATP-dependent helicase/nuclease subunit A
VKYTKEQEEAIKTLDKNLLVSAGAGSGKTRVLVERFIHILLTEAADIDEIVAITFTNKAATEMRERIRRTADEKILGADKEYERNKWLKVKHDVEGARIGTFHGFCSCLLRDNPVEAGVDPAFSVLDEIQMTLILRNTVQDVIFKSLEGGNALIADLVVRYGKDSLARMVKHSYDLVRGSGMSFDDALGVTVKALRESSEMIVPAKMRVLDAGDSLARLDRDTLPQKTKEKLDAFEELWYVARTNIESLDNQAASQRLEPVAELKKALSGSMARHASELKKAFIEELEGMAKLLCDAELIELTRGIFQLLSLCDEQYAMEKAKGPFLDYADLELKTLSLLSRDRDIRKNYQRKFKFVMVDEFQDTNFLQMQIVDLVAGGNVFLVGDYKQSIYRFRGAEVEVFAQSEKSIGAKGGKVISLKTNFRSQQGILDFVNSLFQGIMPKYEGLDAFRSDEDKEYCVECLMLDAGDSAEDSRVEEAQQLAKRIRQMVDSREPLVFERDPKNPGKEKLREVRYGDIAILFRAMTDVKIYEYQLRRAGIPFYVVAGRGFLQRQEVFDVLNALRVLYNRYDAIALVGVLRSPFFGISDETLYWLSRDGDVVGAFESLTHGQLQESFNQYIASDQLRRLEEASEFMQRFRTLIMHLPVSELMRQIILETGYDKIMLTKHDGEQVYANLEKLIELAVEFDSLHGGTLFQFVEYIEIMMDEDMQESEAQIGLEDDDVIKLMTVHKAKGLEFPIVIIPDISRNIETNIGQVVFSRKYGLVLQGKDSQGNSIEGRTRCLVKQLETTNELEESQRAFYVAMTRACDHLVLSGALSSNPRKGAQGVSSWMDMLVSALFEDAQSVQEGLHIFRGQAICIWKRIDWALGKQPSKTAYGHRLVDICPEVKSFYSEEMALELMGKEDMTKHVLSIDEVLPRRQTKRFSPTAIMSYMHCPRQYFLRFVLRIPEHVPAGIGTRSGCFCTHPYVQRLAGLSTIDILKLQRLRLQGKHKDMPGFVRVSFGMYNTKKEIDILVEKLRHLNARTAIILNAEDKRRYDLYNIDKYFTIARTMPQH